MDQDLSVVVAGHLCLDIIPDLGHLQSGEFLRLLKPGHLIEVGPAAFSTGGAVANTGLALHRLGVQTHLMAITGSDLFGQAVIDLIRSTHPRLVEGIQIDPASSTSYTLIVSPPGIDRIFLYNPGANDSFAAGDIDYDEVARARLFHFGYPTLMKRMSQGEGQELISILKRVNETGVTTSLDLSFPDPSSESGRADWRSMLASALPYTAIFLPSIEEILYLLLPETYSRLREKAGGDDLLRWITPDLVADIGAELLSMGVKIVMIKLGCYGIYLRTASALVGTEIGKAAPADRTAWEGREIWAPAFQVRVVGTTGAGDSAIAGFLSALLRDEPPAQALVIAAAAGACSVEAADALSGLPPWPALLSRIQGGWERAPLDLPPSSWRWQPEPGVWLGSQDARF
jgi:sugar/nucleoside kinase (ribokinase family)